jgi:hypothetical protein
MDSKTTVITTTLRDQITLPEGLEPSTSRLTVERANRLRHGSKEKKELRKSCLMRVKLKVWCRKGLLHDFLWAVLLQTA